MAGGDASSCPRKHDRSSSPDHLIDSVNLQDREQGGRIGEHRQLRQGKAPIATRLRLLKVTRGPNENDSPVA